MSLPPDPHPLLPAVRALRAEVAPLSEGPEVEPLTDVLAHWLTAHYVAAVRHEAAKAGGETIDLGTLRALTEDVVALRRGDHVAASLVLERERLELDRHTKVEAGLDALWKEVRSIPDAMNAYDAFARIVRKETGPRAEVEPRNGNDNDNGIGKQREPAFAPAQSD